VEFFLWLRFGAPTIGEDDISTEVSRSAPLGEPDERL
jgi:hypothetical protein